jgi:rhodanese-related sulfurtransferase
MKNISVEELKQKLDSGEKVNLIDCREIQTMQIEDLEDLKEEEVILQCRSGHRSMMACLVLDQLGFKNTNNLTGGILAWQEKYGVQQ